MLPHFNVDFDADTHTYTGPDGQLLISVTTLLKDYKQPFDSDYWSKRKAKERGVDQAVVLAEWKAKSVASCDHGTKIHEGIEDFWNGKYNWNTNPLPELFVRYLSTIYLPADHWASEYRLADLAAGLAGTADFIIFDPATKSFWIWDWKTNEKIRTDNIYQRLAAPLDYLPECELIIYALQLSIYAAMLEKKGWTCKGLKIVHLRDQVTVYDVLRLTTEVDAILQIRTQKLLQSA